ncbi:UNVERIFIED_CONTAM: hypothetical protein FKN15_030261 [Acipenser sinensis]
MIKLSPARTVLKQNCNRKAKITYMTHACMKLDLGSKTMVFDPWLTGPAFARGWWLLHEPPSDWLETICSADLIYISHMHSDHLSYIKETNLKNNPEELNKLITKTSFVSTWTPKSGAVLDMARILKDPLDSEAIIDPPAGTKLYKDNWEFDVYLNEINTAISNEIFQHKDWINFYYNWAGFRDYNLVIRGRRLRRTEMFWTPVLDCSCTGLATEAIIDPPAGTKLYKDNWEFDVYLNEINTAISNEIFQHKDWINFYYNWAGFRDYNLVIRMIETNDDFSPLHSGFDYLVDFLDLSFPNERPARDHFYLEIKNRVGVMRQTVIKGLLWDDLYIGFQNRLFRDPDIYHHQ